MHESAIITSNESSQLSSSFRMSRVVLLNDTFSWYHWGCTATSLGVRDAIRDARHELTCIPVVYTYSLKNGPQNNSEFDDTQVFYRCRTANAQLFSALEAADVVIANGEGTLHGNRHPAIMLLYILYCAKKYLDKNVQIINHSCYPDDSMIVTSSEIVELYLRVYEQMDYIAIREKRSQVLMQQLGIESTLSFDCMPLTIKRHYKNTTVENNNCIILSGSADITESNIKLFSGFINRAHKDGYRVSVLTGAKSYPAPDDHLFIEILKQNCEAPWEWVDAKSLEQWFDEINSAKVLVSGRFHHSIAAAFLGTPSVMFESTTPKMTALSEELSARTPVSRHQSNFSDKLYEEMENAIAGGKVDENVRSMLLQRAQNNFLGIQ